MLDDDVQLAGNLVTTDETGRDLRGPAVGRSVGSPGDTTFGEAPESLAFATSDNPSLESSTTTQSVPDTTIANLTASSAPNTAPATTTAATSAVASGGAAPATTPSAAPRPTAAPSSTSPPATSPPKTTITTTTNPPPTTSAPAGSPGCNSNCRSVGFQNLDGKNGVVLENLIISNPNGRCISLVGASDVTIRNVTIRECGTQAAVESHYDAGLIQIENAANITITNSLIENMSNRGFGSKRNNAVQIESSTGITIRSNTIRKVNSDISNKQNDYGSRSIKVEGSSSNIRIESNRFYDAGRNAVQFSRVRDAGGISITSNVIEGRGRWDSDYEDMINLYSSSGTSQSPIRVAGNRFKNGGPSSTGTGMILGDGNTGSGPSRHIVVENNVFINPGHVGINLAGGDHITIRNNTITGTGPVPLKTTVGMTINHYGYSNECRDHVVAGNRVWMDNQHLPSGTNHLWNPGTCTDNVVLQGNSFGDDSLLG
jgi:parallel beta-helix repeat protein